MKLILDRRIIGRLCTILGILSLLIGLLAFPGSKLLAAEALNTGTSPTLNGDPRHSAYPVDSAYGKPEYLYDTLTICGSGMTQEEKIYSIKEIENLYANPHFGCDVTYSITGSEGKYSSHTLSGIRLYELLVEAGMDTSLPDDTAVTFIAKDGYKSIRTLGDVRNIEQYNYYSDTGQVLAANLPVLLAFATDGYPLVGPIGFQNWFDPTIEGLAAGGINEGGPLKITIGQTAPGDNNAQYNSKLLYKIVVGSDLKSEQHNREPYRQYADDKLTIQLINAATLAVTNSQAYTVEQIEAMVNTKKTALLRNYYPDADSNYYEGIDLWYLLTDKFGLAGNEGEFCFVDASGNESNHISLEYLRNPGKNYSAYYTSKEGVPVTWVKPALAYAQNGEPMQEQGPLMAALPQHKTYLSQGLLQACTGINIYIIQDRCTHSTEPYSFWKNNKLAFTGDGLQTSREFTVENLEKCLELIQDDSYTIGSETANYRGIKLYNLLTSDKLGLKMETDRIEVSSRNGTVVSFTLDELQSSQLKVMLAYGKNNKPLVPGLQDQGYDASVANWGGPIYLAVNGDAERCLEQVVQVKVIAKATERWKHDHAPYDACLDTSFLRICGTAMGQAQIYSLGELEAMDDGIVREYLVASEVRGYYEGLNLKNLLQTAGIADMPAKITVCSPDASGNVFAKPVAVEDVWSGISSTTQNGAIKPVLLAYAKDGYPLVDSIEPDAGYVAEADNTFGPLRLIVENSKPLCVKYVAGIMVGEGTPTAYTVNYLDSASGEAIRKPKISIGADGESIAATAEAIDITGYLYSNADKKQLTLYAFDKASNVLNLYYEKQTEPDDAVIDVAFVVSGSGIPELAYYTRDELKQMASGTHPSLNSERRSYSAMAKGGVKTLIRTKGVDLGAMLQAAKVGAESYTVMTISSDSYRVDLNYNGAAGEFSPQRCYYADILPGDNGVSGPVDPILAFYRAESTEEDRDPHLPTEDELTPVGQFPLPTLTVGQTSEGDYNNQCNNKYVQQVIVGNPYADVFSISGNGLKKKLSYTIPELMLQGMEIKILQGCKCKGISLARFLSEMNNLDDNDMVSIVTESRGGVTIYYEDGLLEHVTELIIGRDDDSAIKLSDLKNPEKQYFVVYNIGEPEIIDILDLLIPRPIYLVKEKEPEKNLADLLALPNKPYVNMALFTEKVADAAGKSKLVLTAEASKAMQEAENGSILLFAGKEELTDITLEISREMLTLMQEKNMCLQLHLNKGDYSIQADDIIMTGIAGALGSEDFVLQIKMNEASEEKSKTIKASLSTDYTFQSVPLQTDMFWAAGKKQMKISDFPT
ncbi:MAG: hypothetical protein ACM3NJ_00320, partial [Methanobacterium sp.]